MKRRYQIFISSTYLDLIDERQALQREVLNLGHFPAGMELFPAGDDSAWNTIKKEIESSDYYALIIGGRYGSLDEAGKGYTEKEYEYARSLKKPVIPFLHRNPDNLPRNRVEGNKTSWKRLLQFRKKIEKSHTCVYWTSADELRAQVGIALTAAFDRYPALGWVKANEVFSKEKIANIFKRNDHSEFHEVIDRLILKSENVNRVILIGTGLNVLHHDPFLQDVVDKAADGGMNIEIYLADPRSPAVEMRLVEEELGSFPIQVGKGGLEQRVDAIVKLWEAKKQTDHIVLRFFTHYPTFALLIVDRNYFMYPYGFAKLGNFSPAFRFSKDDSRSETQAVIKFLDEHYQSVKKASLDMYTVMNIRKKKDVSIDKLIPMAVYFIPDQTSSLYQFGVNVLGYDIRKDEISTSKWQDKVGDAKNFGFHMTLCDALYFLNPIQIKEAECNLKLLANSLNRFCLENIQFKLNFPNKNSISLSAYDASGNLEALHCELVQRIYRNAIGSFYTQKQNIANRDNNLERTQLMISRYQAPYILQHFQPHFTLLANVSVEEQPKIKKELEELWNDLGCSNSINVQKLAIMMCPQPDAPWVIQHEIALGQP